MLFPLLFNQVNVSLLVNVVILRFKLRQVKFPLLRSSHGFSISITGVSAEKTEHSKVKWVVKFVQTWNLNPVPLIITQRGGNAEAFRGTDTSNFNIEISKAVET